MTNLFGLSAHQKAFIPNNEIINKRINVSARLASAWETDSISIPENLFTCNIILLNMNIKIERRTIKAKISPPAIIIS